MSNPTKRCPNCERTLPLDDFYKHKRWGRTSWCKACTKTIANRPAQRNRTNGLCKCGKKTRPGKASCVLCAKKMREYTKNRRLDPARAEEDRQHSRDSYRRLKALLFEAYGNACLCCGETLIEFLTIDHIIPVGATGHHERAGVGLYRKLKREGFPEGFRTLCLNCNFALGHHGYCPHNNGIVPGTGNVVTR